MDPSNLIDETPEPAKKTSRFGRFFGAKKSAPQKSTNVEPNQPEKTDASTASANKSSTSVISNTLPAAFPPPENAQLITADLENTVQPTVQSIDPSTVQPVVQPVHPAAEQPAIDSPAPATVQSAPAAVQPAPPQPEPATQPAPAHRPPSGEAVVDVRNITKIYTMGDMEVHALRGINLTIKQGEMVAVMGPSGSGKSTLMNIIGCLDVPTAGDYFLDSVDVSKLNDNALAEIRCHKIGFVFQSFNLLARTSAIANVELPLIYSGNSGRTRRQRAADSLGLVGLGDRLDHKPNELSGGQQQRVAIARSLINQPAMILADEPTGNLDTATSVEIMHLFQKLNREQGITIVFVTHDPETAEYCQRVIHFRDGVIERDERR